MNLLDWTVSSCEIRLVDLLSGFSGEEFRKILEHKYHQSLMALKSKLDPRALLTSEIKEYIQKQLRMLSESKPLAGLIHGANG